MNTCPPLAEVVILQLLNWTPAPLQAAAPEPAGTHPSAAVQPASKHGC